MVLAHYQFAKCYLFEPNEGLYSDLKERFVEERVFNIAISRIQGSVPFYRCVGKADELSSTYKREIFGEVEYVEERKPSTSIDIFCNEKDIHFIDVLKIDSEGAELDILRGSTEMLKSKFVRFIQVEYGGTYKDAGITFMEVIEFVSSFGYKVYELINDKLSPITADTFVEDYRFTNFLITRHDFR